MASSVLLRLSRFLQPSPMRDGATPDRNAAPRGLRLCPLELAVRPRWAPGASGSTRRDSYRSRIWCRSRRRVVPALDQALVHDITI